LSRRQQTKQASGRTFEEQTRERRQKRLTPKRRRELDRLARETLAQLGDDDERRYLLDAITQRLVRKAGRPTGDHAQWARDITELDGDTSALAERWGVDAVAVRQRKATVRKYANKITAAS
jgi:predicted P-loop ATPase